jgi:hypothetical protein
MLRNAVISISLRREDLTGVLPEIATPTLMVTGSDHDGFTPAQAEAAARLMPAGRAAVVPEAAYLVPLEEPTGGALPCCCGHSTEREGSLTVTTPPRDAQQEILRALFDHFDRSADHLTPEQVAEMTAFPLDVTEKALRVLLNENRIEAITAAEGRGVPVFVTGVVYYQ